MNEKQYKQISYVLTIFLMILSLSVLGWGYYNYRQAQNIINPERTIIFSAEGKVLAKPDVAKTVIQVITQGTKAEVVQEENNKKMTEAITFIKEQGVLADDIQTSSYNLTPQYDYDWCRLPGEAYRSCPPKIIGYELNQGITIKIRDFDKINTIIGGLSEKGVNKISNISFEVDEPEVYKNEARIKALNEIEERAKILSAKTNIRLGKIINVTEGQPSYPIYRSLDLAQGVYNEGMKMMAEEDSIAPIETGTQEISITLSAIYEIK